MRRIVRVVRRLPAVGQQGACWIVRSVHHHERWLLAGGVGDWGAGSVQRDVCERAAGNRLSTSVDECCRGGWGLLGKRQGIRSEHRLEMEGESSWARQ
jgi:hypothetical protein